MADATVDCRKWQPTEADMADPTTYEPGYDFTATDEEAEINAEIDNIAASAQSLAAAVADVRRSDGQLQNQIVTMDNALVSGDCLAEANGTDYFEVYGTGFGVGNKTVALTTTMTFFEGEAI